MSYVGGVAAEQLKSIVERIERLEQDKTNLANDIRDVYAEARGNGYDTKTLRTIIKLRKMDESDRSEQEELLDLYMHALGMAIGSSEKVEETEMVS
jgi:uncharacterized protein (UPF0335 family)